MPCQRVIVAEQAISDSWITFHGTILPDETIPPEMHLLDDDHTVQWIRSYNWYHSRATCKISTPWYIWNKSERLKCMAKEHLHYSKQCSTRFWPMWIYIYSILFKSLYLPQGLRYRHPIFTTLYHTISLCMNKFWYLAQARCWRYMVRYLMWFKTATSSPASVTRQYPHPTPHPTPPQIHTILYIQTSLNIPFTSSTCGELASDISWSLTLHKD